MIYVTSDIHGNVAAWKSIKKQIDLQNTDELFILGDVIDRNYGGLYILLEIMDDPRMTMLLGNHEAMMLSRFNHPDNQILKDHWYINGGGITEDEFNKLSDNTKAKILQYIESLDIQVRIPAMNKDIMLVHSVPMQLFDPEIDVKYSNAEMFSIWDRSRQHQKIDCGFTVVHGHTPTISLDGDTLPPKIIHTASDWYNIDCGASHRDVGRLACLRLNDMQEFYSCI